MRYFVTGATGFIGSRLVHQLVAAGHQVVALVRDPARAGQLAQLGVTLAQGDVTDKESMRAAMAGTDGLFHIAGWYQIGARDKRPAQRVNVQGTRNVLELMRDLGLPKGVYTSTLAVFSDTQGRMVDESYRYTGPHLNEYDRTKRLAHYRVAEPMIEQGLPLVIVMPGAVYGPGDHSLVAKSFEAYLQRKLPLVPRGAALCWGHVSDVVRGHLLAMDKGRPGESYIIAGPPHTLEDAFELAERITGIPVPRLHLSPTLLRLMSGLMRVVGSVVPLPDTYRAESLRVTAGVTYLGRNDKARRELGYQVRPLEEGLRETLFYMMQKLGIELPERPA
ncbi:MAG: NAD-dependent epimerase/dehydratase family protein [Chloroflexia bacterium]|nr:NAD-dependent epimerase/dehydratase family protein [Chloroflexia bacterium]